MNISLKQLRAFVLVADSGSFVRAAEQLNVSPSCMSMLIRELEAQLGVEVLFRTTRHVRLTDAGAEFMPPARKALEDLNLAINASRSLAQLKRGRVTISSSVVASASFLPLIIKRFVLSHPGIQCVLKDGHEEAIRDQVRRNEVDLGIGTLLESEDELSEKILLEDHLVAIFPEGHVLTLNNEVSWNELSSFPIVALSSRSPSRRLADAAFSSVGIIVTPSYEASFSSTIISMVAAGLGVAALPKSVIQVACNFNVVSRKLINPNVQRKLGVIARSNVTISPAAAAFRNHLIAFADSELLNTNIK